ncbi:MAG: hypothetical protein A4E63_01853 [Syntrophorhabdus sp. PtaU1.Bin050]|nr:MAG: hypothetical protein A4E63_01853 [Syntrophorhabdus sp. PtaU1.Bin050]
MTNNKVKIMQDTMKIIEGESGISQDTKDQLLNNLQKVLTPLQTDKWVYRLVVGFLGFTVLVTVVGGLILNGKTGSAIPEGIIALGSAAVGALAGLIAPSPGSR